MLPFKNGLSFFSTCLTLMGTTSIYASQPIFSIIPTPDSITSLLLPSNFSEVVRYQVTNNSNLTRTLTMKPITAVTQTTVGAGVCGNPFVLAPFASCTLTLTINGSEVPSSGIQGGPVVCKTRGGSDNSPDPYVCSQPSRANILDVSAASAGQHAYIANQLGNSVSFCQVNPATGFLTQCAVTATGLSGVEGVGFNRSGTLFYSANLLSSTISVCEANQTTGALSNCMDAGGSGFSAPDAVAFSPDGSIFYTANVAGSVTACLVNAVNGQLSSCVNNVSATFSAPSDMALNAAGTLAYVSNRFNSTVSVCNVSGQTVDSCNNLSGSLFNEPEGITLSPSGLYAYIANAGDGLVIVCRVAQDATGLLENCSATNGHFHGTGNVGFNALGIFAYIPDELTSTVSRCQVNNVDGSFSTCLPSLGMGFNGPSGVVIH